MCNIDAKITKKKKKECENSAALMDWLTGILPMRTC